MSDLADILSGKSNINESSSEAPPTAEGGTNNDSTLKVDDDGVEVESLEVAGVIRDKYGNTWQVPGDNVQDLDDIYSGDIIKIPDELKAVFHIQMIHVNELKAYTVRGFVPVLQEELAIPEQLIKDMGQPLDKYYVVHDAIMVKIPHQIHQRIKAREVKEVKDRLISMNPTQEMLKKANRDGIMMSYEHKTSVTQADPKNRQGIFADEKGVVNG